MNKFNTFTFQKKLRKLGLEEGSTVYVTGNLGKIGFPYSLSGTKIKSKIQILEFYLNTILEIIGVNGTIIFPTHSFDLIKNQEIFDPNETPTNYTFSEFLRIKLQSRRQVHPYASISSYGKYAKKIIPDLITKHAYGLDSPYTFFENNECLFISLGLPLRKSISAVHYCEFKVGVPYRYTKSFKQLLRLNGKESLEEFFLYVWYDDVQIVRDGNKKIFSIENIRRNTKKELIGNSFAESIPINIFIRETIQAMLIDPYIWTKEIKGNKGYIPWEK